MRAASRAQLSLDAALLEAFVCAPPAPRAPSPESCPSAVVAASACRSVAAAGAAGCAAAGAEAALVLDEPARLSSAASESEAAASTALRAEGATDNSGRM